MARYAESCPEYFMEAPTLAGREKMHGAKGAWRKNFTMINNME